MGGVEEFDLDSSVEPVGDHSFRATITDRWNTFAGPNGGYVLAILTRALLTEVPFPDPLSVSAHFLRPPHAGPAEVRTELIRSGRRHASAQGSMIQDGKEIARVIATFTDLEHAAGRTLSLGSAPELPPLDDCVDPLGITVDGLPRPSLIDRLEFRAPALPGWLRGEPSGDPSAEFWIRFRDGGMADTVALAFLVDAGAPTVLELGEFITSTVELTVHLRGRPATDWLAFRQSTRYLTSGYHDEDVEIWDANGTLVAQARQLAILG
jgi:acyl-CoA thioesterase